MPDPSFIDKMQKRKQEKMLKDGPKKKFVDYSFKAKAAFAIGTLVAFVAELEIYNSAMNLVHLFDHQEVDNHPLHILVSGLQEHPLVMIILAVIAYGIGRLCMRFFSGRANRDPRGFRVVEEGTEGSSKFLSEEEKRRVFSLLDAKTPDGIIVGKDKQSGELITIPWKNPNADYTLPNFNVALFGPPGTRKTSGVLLPNIYNFIASGISIAVTDPKGEIYKETLAAATYFNYRIRVFNLMPGNFQHSDGWDFLKLIRESDNPHSAADLAATVIMENTGGSAGHDSFWYDANINLLKCCLLYVAKGVGFTACTPANSAGETRTIEAVYDLITSPDLAATIQASIDANKEDRKLLQQAFNIWHSHREAESIKSGLGIRLSILQNPDLVRVLSEDEINFQELNDHPTIIYIVSSDQDTTYKSILTLFFSFLFKTTVEIADSHDSQTLDRRLMLVMEEAANIGRIPDLDKRVATLRSRGIGMILCYQNLGQIMDAYGSTSDGRHKYETILGGCAVQLCLSANDPTGQEYFSRMSGKMTLEVKSSAQNVATFAPEALKWNTNERVQKMQRGRPVMMPDDVKKIKPSEIMIVPSQRDILLEDKYYYKDHPMYAIQMVDQNEQVVTCLPSKHVPNWLRQKLLIEQREVLRNSPVTAQKMLSDDLQPMLIPGYGKRQKEEDMGLPWYLRILSPFVEFEMVDDEKDADSGEIERQSSSHAYSAFSKQSEYDDYEATPAEKRPQVNRAEEESGPSDSQVEKDTTFESQVVSPPAPDADDSPYSTWNDEEQDEPSLEDDSTYKYEQERGHPQVPDPDEEEGWPDAQPSSQEDRQWEALYTDAIFEDMDIF